MRKDDVLARLNIKRPLTAEDHQSLVDWLRACAKSIKTGKFDECHRFTLYE